MHTGADADTGRHRVLETGTRIIIINIIIIIIITLYIIIIII